MKQVYGQHLIFVVVSEDVGVVAFDGGYALFFLQLLNGGDQVTIARGAFELLRLGGIGHTFAQRFDQIGWTSFEKKLYVADRLRVDRGCGQIQNARTEAPLYIKLKAGARMTAG